MNFAGGMDVGDAFSPSNIDKTDVLISGITGMNPFSIPGGKYGAAATAALGDVAINVGKASLNGEEYSTAQAGQDFLIGFAAQLGSEKVVEFFGNNAKNIGNKADFTVTPDGVAIKNSDKYTIPDNYIENPHGRSGSYGVIENGKFNEKLRIDPATPSGQKGPNYSHYHLDGKGQHYSPNPKDKKDPGFSGNN